jgi:hypothetical protein
MMIASSMARSAWRKGEAMTVEIRKAPTYRYRLATIDDVLAILSALVEVAAEIPLSLDTTEQREAALKCVEKCSASGDTWVALDHDNTIIGFLLAEQKEQYIHLPYGGVQKVHRDNDIFPELLEKVKERKQPLRASVALSNEKMPGYLHKLGFAFQGNSLTEALYLWQPNPSDHSAGGG